MLCTAESEPQRPLIQARMQLRPLDPATPVTGLKVRLVGKKTDIGLDAGDRPLAIGTLYE